MKKIMFNDMCGLTKDVLEGYKTMTRQISKYDTIDNILAFSHYKCGEVVAVAQSYKSILVKGDSDVLHYMFLEDNVELDKKGWNNKMFVRADLMPFRIKFTDLRAERLQNISNEDCIKEGIRTDGYQRYYYNIRNFPVYFSTPQAAFASLIDKTCGKGVWSNNPWVVVYEYELLKLSCNKIL